MAGELITASMQVQWRDALIGDPDGRIRLTEVRGWLESPDMRVGDVDRPGRHGMFAGELRTTGRIIEVDWRIVDDDEALAQMRGIGTPSENPAEEPLALWVGTDEVQMVQARCHRWSIPTTVNWTTRVYEGSLMFKATDPRRYSINLSTASTGLPAPAASGLAFPLAFPLDFGAGTSGGEIMATNQGAAATWPVFTVTGPVTGPVITNLNTGQRLQFAGDFTVAAGQELVIDTDARTALIGGVTRRNELITAQWFPINADSSARIGFTASSYDASAQLQIQWRSAWM
jgi:hypothetical protein